MDAVTPPPRRRAPGAGRKPSPAVAARNAAIAADYLAGRTAADLAADHGLSMTGLYKILRAASARRARPSFAADPDRIARRKAYMAAYLKRWLADPATRERRKTYLAEVVAARRLDPEVRRHERAVQADYRERNRALLREKSKQDRRLMTEAEKIETRERRGAERLARMMAQVGELETRL